jgi:predicted Na+-dependent transporter
VVEPDIDLSSAPDARARSLAGRVPDTLPGLALLAALLARVLPSATLASRVDVLLGVLVLATALDIDPRQLLAVGARWRLVLLLAVVPLVVLTLAGWALAQLAHGDMRDGVLALGLSPTEVASVGLIGLLAGPAELGIAVLAVSLVLSAVAGPPALAMLGGAGHAAHVLPLLGRFGLVVILPLALGLLARGAQPRLARAEAELSAASSLTVAVLIYASLSGTPKGDLAGAALLSGGFLAISALLAVGTLRALGTLHAPGGSADRSLALAVGMRDFAVAAALATGTFGAKAAYVTGIYGVLMLLAGAGVTGVVRRARP